MTLSVWIPGKAPFVDMNGSPYTLGEAATPDEAAVTMQKLYRGYRTRRQLADCAVIARKYDWWNVLEGVTLRHNSEDFYDAKRQDSLPKTKWTRLKNKAAKLGRGLAKDEHARGLAFQHWLEAIDARHRYGHNLHYYYVAWSKTATQEPFFYWLDVGEGRNLDLKELPRSKLNKEQISYLGPRERKIYEVSIKNGIWFYKRRKEIIDTTSEGRWIFVMSPSGSIYVGKKQKGKFQHSSFLAGGAAKAAGRLSIKEGTLMVLEPHSGHYRPTTENFQNFLKVLENKGIDLATVQVQFSSHEMSRAHMKSLKSLSSQNEDSVQIESTFTEDVTTSEATDGLTLADDLATNHADEESLILQEVVEALTPHRRNEQAAQPAPRDEAQPSRRDEQAQSQPARRDEQAQSQPARMSRLSLSQPDEQAQPAIEPRPLVEDTQEAPSSAPKEELQEQNEQQKSQRATIIEKFRPSKLSLQRQSSVTWCSGAGCRLSSLSIIPPSVRSQAFEVMQTPRVQTTVRW